MSIQEDEVEYFLSPERKEYINRKYNDKDFLEPLNIRKYYRTPDSIAYRKQKHWEIFGCELEL